MFTTAWWKAAGARALRTGAQVLLVAIGADGSGIVHIDFGGTAALVGGSVIASLLNSIIAPPVESKPEVTKE